MNFVVEKLTPGIMQSMCPESEISAIQAHGLWRKDEIHPSDCVVIDFTANCALCCLRSYDIREESNRYVLSIAGDVYIILASEKYNGPARVEYKSPDSNITDTEIAGILRSAFAVGGRFCIGFHSPVIDGYSPDFVEFGDDCAA